MGWRRRRVYEPVLRRPVSQGHRHAVDTRCQRVASDPLQEGQHDMHGAGLKIDLFTATSAVIGSRKSNPTRNQRARSTGAPKIWKFSCSLSAMVPSRNMAFSLSRSRPSPITYKMRCTTFWASRSDAIPSSSKRPFNSERVRLHRARGSEMRNVRGSHSQ